MPTEHELRAALLRVALERVACQSADARANAPRRSAVTARSSGPPSVVYWLEMLAAGMVQLDD
jgi:hypothetical protein